MTAAKKGPIVVTVDDDHLPDIQQVADALRSAGMEVGKVSPTVGIITGSAPPAGLSKLAAVPGVAAVEPDEEMRAI